jgi:DNA-binding HxlR family transcriptional regulator
LHECATGVGADKRDVVQPDAVERAVDVFSDRWTFLILREARDITPIQPGAADDG